MDHGSDEKDDVEERTGLVIQFRASPSLLWNSPPLLLKLQRAFRHCRLHIRHGLLLFFLPPVSSPLLPPSNAPLCCLPRMAFPLLPLLCLTPSMCCLSPYLFPPLFYLLNNASPQCHPPSLLSIQVSVCSEPSIPFSHYPLRPLPPPASPLPPWRRSHTPFSRKTSLTITDLSRLFV